MCTPQQPPRLPIRTHASPSNRSIRPLIQFFNPHTGDPCVRRERRPDPAAAVHGRRPGRLGRRQGARVNLTPHPSSQFHFNRPLTLKHSLILSSTTHAPGDHRVRPERPGRPRGAQLRPLRPGEERLDAGSRKQVVPRAPADAGCRREACGGGRGERGGRGAAAQGGGAAAEAGEGGREEEAGGGARGPAEPAAGGAPQPRGGKAVRQPGALTLHPPTPLRPHAASYFTRAVVFAPSLSRRHPSPPQI